MVDQDGHMVHSYTRDYLYCLKEREIKSAMFTQELEWREERLPFFNCIFLQCNDHNLKLSRQEVTYGEYEPK